MFVKVNGANIEVEVSDGGMFHDKATKSISSTTLKGITKKLREANTPKGGFPVEEDGKKGVVVGRVASKGWRKSHFIVRWEDNSQTEVGGYSLTIPLSEEHKVKLAELGAKYAATQKANSVAYNELLNYKASLLANKHLEEIFPLE